MKRRVVIVVSLSLVFLIGVFMGISRPERPVLPSAQPGEPELKRLGRRSPKGKTLRGDQELKGASPASPNAPNVLIILWDTVRADRIGIYGASRDTTPFVDRFAQNSAVFERAISPAMWTVPAHASLFTGLAVSEHGATVQHRQLDGRFETMAERFRDGGYDTYAFSANPNLNPRSIGLVQGFDTVELSWSKDYRHLSAAVTKKKLIEHDISTEISPGRKNSANNEEVFFNASPVGRRLFRRWLKQRNSGKPFLAYINMMEAHKPRVPALKTREEVIGDPELIELGLKTSITEPEQVKFMAGLKSYSDEEKLAIQAVYDASLRELDSSTRGISEDLRAAGFLENTIIVLVSDHGEALGEHGLFAHKYGLYDELVRVPLLIHYPKVVSAKRYPQPVTTRNLYPTLLDLAGLERPEGMDNPSLFSDEGPDVVVSEIVSTNAFKYLKLLQKYPEANIEPFLRAAQLLETGGYKLISYQDGVRELYQLASDPLELTDLALQETERVADMEQQLEEWRSNLTLWEAEEGVPEVIAPSGEEEKLLQLLGYVE